MIFIRPTGAVYILLHDAVHNIPLFRKIRLVLCGNGLCIGFTVVIEAFVNVADLASIKSIEIEDCILRSADDPLADKHPFTGKVCFHQTHAER